MAIKKELLEMLDTDSKNIRNIYFSLENLVLTMLTDYISKQAKEIISLHGDFQARFDAIAPSGFDDYKGNTGIIIKMSRNRLGLKNIIANVEKMIDQEEAIDNLIIIVMGEIDVNYKNRILEEYKKIHYNLVIWDINKIEEIFETNPELYRETLNNLNKFLFKDTVTKGISEKRSTYIEKREKHLIKLEEKYNQDDVVLFLGAGTSLDAKIATWDILISELFVTLINHQLDKHGIKLDEKQKDRIVKEIIKQNGNSPLLQTRFIRQGIEEEFEDEVRKILYKGATYTSDLLNSIAQLCVPIRGKMGIRAIINYNFDDLVEKNLEKLNLNYSSIYREGVMPNSYELGIFHVHGFLPQTQDGFDNLAKSLLVFSEEGYHKLMLDPYNWANITQLNYLMNNTCIFIGLSMTDPNLRRLLDIAAQKDIDEKCKHYVIMKRFTIEKKEEENVTSFEAINEELQESFYRELGVNIIWINEFDEIPQILKKIKRNSTR